MSSSSRTTFTPDTLRAHVIARQSAQRQLELEKDKKAVKELMQSIQESMEMATELPIEVGMEGAPASVVAIVKEHYKKRGFKVEVTRRKDGDEWIEIDC